MLRFFVAILILSLSSCIDNASNNKNLNAGNIFFDYKIRGDEKDSDVTVYLQYRIGGPFGRPLSTDDSLKVELDGTAIPAGSARLTGPYYEVRIPAREFAGKHWISWSSPGKTKFQEEFAYFPFDLKTRLPSVIHRGDLVLDFNGLQPTDVVRVTMTDTSFLSRDVIEIDTVKKGSLVIPANKLNDLVNGPIILLVSKETERTAGHGTGEWGRILVGYGLQREFELRDSARRRP